MQKGRIEKERGFWSGFAGKYDRFMKRLGGAYSEMYSILLKEMKPGFNVCEIACGTGLVSMEIAPLVKKLSASDISPEMIKIAGEKARAAGITNADFRVMDAYGLDYPDGSFDAAVACNVLHLLFEPKQVLSELGRVLKKGGMLIAPTFCHGEGIRSRLVSRIMGLAGFEARTRWSLEGLEKFIGDSGFEIRENKVIKATIPLLYITAVSSGN